MDLLPSLRRTTENQILELHMTLRELAGSVDLTKAREDLHDMNCAVIECFSQAVRSRLH